MKRIADILVLFLASSLITIYKGGFTDTVVTVLTALIFTAVILCINTDEEGRVKGNDKYILAATFAVFCIAGCIFPIFCIYLPVVVYIAVYYRPYYYGAMLLLVLHYDKMQPEILVGVGVLALVAFMLGYSTKRMDILENRIISLRDESTENNIKLKEKNRQIIINQDNEIHLATLKERNRIAREIHDNVGHMLTRSILQVGALAAVYKEEPLHSSIKEINETLNTAMNNIRESVHDIHDESVDLKQAIDECTAEVKEKYNLKTDYDMSKHIPKKVKYSFIAIVKEAMSNIIKHSNGTDVYLMAREHPGFYQLIIEDNGNVSRANDKSGTGFGDSSDGIGLVNMKERVDSLGGTMHVNTEDGFKIFISVPKDGNE